MKGYVLKPEIALVEDKANVRRWRHIHTYTSMYKQVTARNWSYVRREAVHQAINGQYASLEKNSDYPDMAYTFPCRVTFDQYHDGRPLHVTLDEAMIDGVYSVIELSAHDPPEYDVSIDDPPF